MSPSVNDLLVQRYGVNATAAKKLLFAELAPPGTYYPKGEQQQVIDSLRTLYPAMGLPDAIHQYLLDNTDPPEQNLWITGGKLIAGGKLTTSSRLWSL